jgi:hypothetical protein
MMLTARSLRRHVKDYEFGLDLILDSLERMACR